MFGPHGDCLVYGLLLDIFFDVRNKVHIKLFMYKVQRNYKCDILCYEWLGFLCISCCNVIMGAGSLVYLCSLCVLYVKVVVAAM